MISQKDDSQKDDSQKDDPQKNDFPKTQKLFNNKINTTNTLQ